MLTFSVLASGSRANCVYIKHNNTQLLIDCGLSAKQTALRLEGIGVAPEEIAAILVTHEHSDHVAGVRVFAKRFGNKVFCNDLTFDNSRELQAVSSNQIEVFQTGEPFSVDDITISPFSVIHDAADPVAFHICAGSSSLAVLTDLGSVTELVRTYAADVDALVLESNHCPKLLEDAPYPWGLKQRISSRTGHLSNAAAGVFIKELSVGRSKSLKVIVAAHISENSNTPLLALQTLQESWSSETKYGLPKFIAASVHEATELFEI